MKVILLQDVKSLGKKGDVVETAEGYGRNYLLPRKLAKEATAANLNQAKADKATAAHRAAHRAAVGRTDERFRCRVPFVLHCVDRRIFHQERQYCMVEFRLCGNSDNRVHVSRRNQCGINLHSP